MDQTVQQSQLRIALTREQTEQIKQATGKEVPAVKLALVELEQRIAPDSCPVPGAAARSGQYRPFGCHLN
jgi:hypothetical protein